MDVVQVKEGLINFIDQLNQRLTELFSFVTDKLRHFKDLSLGEQISYSAIGLGLVLILVSIILFMV